MCSSEAVHAIRDRMAVKAEIMRRVSNQSKNPAIKAADGRKCHASRSNLCLAFVKEVFFHYFWTFLCAGKAWEAPSHAWACRFLAISSRFLSRCAVVVASG